MEAYDYRYQYGFSEVFAEYQYDVERQNQKAWKVLSVLRDFYGKSRSLTDLTLLDVGCSAGLMTNLYGHSV